MLKASKMRRVEGRYSRKVPQPLSTSSGVMLNALSLILALTVSVSQLSCPLLIIPQDL